MSSGTQGLEGRGQREASELSWGTVGSQLVLVESTDVLMQVELESGSVRAVGAGMGLLAGVGERVIPQPLVLVAPGKHLVAEGTHQGPRGNALQHNTTVTTTTSTIPSLHHQSITFYYLLIYVRFVYMSI